VLLADVGAAATDAVVGSNSAPATNTVARLRMA
jgi:hypothetical protein